MEEDVVESALPVEASAEAAVVDLGGIALILEALLLASEAPLSLDQLVKLVGVEFNLGKRELREALSLLGERHAGTASELVEVASGFRLQVRPQYAEWVARLWQEKPAKYSRALLETLALIVYRQPITRGEIEEVRGVAVSSNILRTLLERGWIRELGHKEVPGRPTLFGTTAQFLDDFNLKTLNQLPPLPDVKDLEQLEAALAKLGAGALPPVEDEDEDGEGAAALAAPAEADAVPEQANAESAAEPEADTGGAVGSAAGMAAAALAPSESPPQAESRDETPSDRHEDTQQP